MEAPEAIFTGSNDHTQIIKGKRTKRQRPPSPFGAAVTSSTSSGGAGAGSGSGGEGEYCSTLSPSSEVSESTEEEEDMANCLILLAQGNGPRQIEEGGGRIEKFSSRKFTEMANTTTGKAGFYLYECKTCNRTFPSFQALGGHRASHKRPKAMVEEKKVPTLPSDHEFQVGQFNKNCSPPFSLQQIDNKALHSNNKSRVHECSICGSEFSSGQALGGHMRRHRTSSSTRITMSMDTNTIDDSHDVEKPRNILPLDLNLPAPEDDNRDSKFQFTSNQQRLIFPPTALVDCHY